MSAVRLINQAGLDLVKRWEGLFLRAYRDVAGVWTIGWGHTGGVYKGQAITLSEAERLLAMDMADAEAFVDARTQPPSFRELQPFLAGLSLDAALTLGAATDNQFAAMVSLTFNIGNGGFNGSTVLRRHKEGNFAAAADAFLLWKKAHVDGELVTVQGLLNRRRDERKLYLT